MNSSVPKRSVFDRLLVALKTESWRQDQPPKRHHTVPRVYLQHFAQPRRTPSPQPTTNKKKKKKKKQAADTVVYDLHHEPPRSGHIRELDQVTVETHYYRLNTTDPRDQSIVEHLLGLIENATGPVLQRLREPGTYPDPHERIDLTAFVAMQLVRGSLTKTMLSAHGTQIAQMVGELAISNREAARAMLGRIGEDTSDESVTALQESFHDFGIHVVPNQSMFLMRMLEGFYNACVFVHGRHWAIMESEAPYLTTDEPVVMHPGTRPDDYGLKSMAASPVVSLPINRFRCLALFRPDKPIKTPIVKVPSLATHFLNQIMVASARRFVIHHPDDGSALGVDITNTPRKTQEPRLAMVPRASNPDPDEGSD